MFKMHPVAENVVGSAAYDLILRLCRWGGPPVLTGLLLFNKWIRTAPPLALVSGLIGFLLFVFMVIYTLTALFEKRFKKHSSNAATIILPTKYAQTKKPFLTGWEIKMLAGCGLGVVVAALLCFCKTPSKKPEVSDSNLPPVFAPEVISSSSNSLPQRPPSQSLENPLPIQSDIVMNMPGESPHLFKGQILQAPFANISFKVQDISLNEAMTLIDVCTPEGTLARQAYPDTCFTNDDQRFVARIDKIQAGYYPQWVTIKIYEQGNEASVAQTESPQLHLNRTFQFADTTIRVSGFDADGGAFLKISQPDVFPIRRHMVVGEAFLTNYYEGKCYVARVVDAATNTPRWIVIRFNEQDSEVLPNQADQTQWFLKISKIVCNFNCPNPFSAPFRLTAIVNDSTMNFPNNGSWYQDELDGTTQAKTIFPTNDVFPLPPITDRYNVSFEGLIDRVQSYAGMDSKKKESFKPDDLPIAAIYKIKVGGMFVPAQSTQSEITVYYKITNEP
jgi:hypothetical protein